MKKALLYIILGLLLAGSVHAFGASSYDESVRMQFTELCPWHYEETFLSKHISFISPEKVWDCDFSEVIEGKEGYDASPDVARACYRACWAEDLVFAGLDAPLSWFDSPECLCSPPGSHIVYEVKNYNVLNISKDGESSFSGRTLNFTVSKAREIFIECPPKVEYDVYLQKEGKTLLKTNLKSVCTSLIE